MEITIKVVDVWVSEVLLDFNFMADLLPHSGLDNL